MTKKLYSQYQIHQQCLANPTDLFFPANTMCEHGLSNKLTFKTVALPSPVATKTTVLAALITGSVRVTLSGGGLGESLMGATILSVT